jgi:hypothetical protein
VRQVGECVGHEARHAPRADLDEGSYSGAVQAPNQWAEADRFDEMARGEVADAVRMAKMSRIGPRYGASMGEWNPDRNGNT